MKVTIVILCVLLAVIGIIANGYAMNKSLKLNRRTIIAAISLLIISIAILIIKRGVFKEIDLKDIGSILTINVLFFAAIIDIKERQLPIMLFLIYAAIGICLGFFASGLRYIYTLAFAAIVFMFLFLCSKKSNEKIGMGDCCAISCTALYYVPSTSMGIVIISMFISLIIAAFIAVRKKTGMSTTIPYIPSLWIAVLIALYIG